jgi:hypothetical protein
MLLDMVRTDKTFTILKEDVDGFSYFSLSSVIFFSNQDHPQLKTMYRMKMKYKKYHTVLLPPIHIYMITPFPG